MITNISDVITIMGADGITKYNSPNVEKWFGYKPGELIGKNGLEKVHPEDIDRIQKELINVLEKESASTVEFRLKCKDGKYKWVELTAVNRISESEINGVLLNYHNITERKQADKDLKESEKKYKELSENSPLAIYLTDKNGKCIYVNPKWLLLSGMDYNDAIGDGWRNAIYQEDREVVYNNCDNYINKKTKWGCEYRFQHKNGSITWVYGTGVILFDEKDEITGYLGTNLDVTEHKFAEEELAKYRENLEELVNERTKELEGANKDLLIKNKELERFNDLFADREFRIKELREKVKELENKNG
jgi:PAS domain S-box-containing protein